MQNIQISKPTNSDVSVRQMVSRLARMSKPPKAIAMKSAEQTLSTRNRQMMGRLFRRNDNIPTLYDVVK